MKKKLLLLIVLLVALSGCADDGRDGKDGVNGKMGIGGKDGIQGLLGPSGFNGADGSNGLTGPPGATYEQLLEIMTALTKFNSLCVAKDPPKFLAYKVDDNTGALTMWCVDTPSVDTPKS